jgi:hypothetical protein
VSGRTVQTVEFFCARIQLTVPATSIMGEDNLPHIKPMIKENLGDGSGVSGFRRICVRRYRRDLCDP